MVQTRNFASQYTCIEITPKKFAPRIQQKTIRFLHRLNFTWGYTSQIRNCVGNTLTLFRYFIMGSSLKDLLPWISTVAITWMLLIIFTTYGIHNSMRGLPKFQVISFISWIFLCTLVSLKPKADTLNEFLSERELLSFLNLEVRRRGIFDVVFITDLLKFTQFWTNSISYCTQISVLCTDIWIGTLLPKNFHVRNAVIIFTVIKLVTLIVVVSQSSYIARVIMAQYGVFEKICLALSGN